MRPQWIRMGSLHDVWVLYRSEEEDFKTKRHSFTVRKSSDNGCTWSHITPSLGMPTACSKQLTELKGNKGLCLGAFRGGMVQLAP